MPVLMPVATCGADGIDACFAIEVPLHAVHLQDVGGGDRDLLAAQ